MNGPLRCPTKSRMTQKRLDWFLFLVDLPQCVWACQTKSFGVSVELSLSDFVGMSLKKMKNVFQTNV